MPNINGSSSLRLVAYQIHATPPYQNISLPRVADPPTPVPAKAGSGLNNRIKHEPLIKDVLSLFLVNKKFTLLKGDFQDKNEGFLASSLSLCLRCEIACPDISRRNQSLISNPLNNPRNPWFKIGKISAIFQPKARVPSNKNQIFHKFLTYLPKTIYERRETDIFSHQKRSYV